MTVFDGNCTLPTHSYSFVSSPDVRGTSDIIWSCLSILILSTWTILHLNIPTQATPKGKGQSLRRKASSFYLKFLWMVVNILAPEWAFGKAWSDYRSVSLLHASFEDLKEKDGVSWSRAHTYLANMGGFAVRFAHSLPCSYESCAAEGKHRPREQESQIAAGSGPNVDSDHQRLASKNDQPHQEADSVTEERPSIDHGGLSTAQPGPVAPLPPVLPQSSLCKQSTTEQASSQTMPAHKAPKDLGSLDTDKQAPAQTSQLPVQHTEIPLFVQAKIKMIPRYNLIQQQVLDNDRWLLGEVDWRVDDSNALIVDEAFATVQQDDFDLGRDRSLLLNSYLKWIRSMCMLRGDLWVLDASQLLEARKMGIIRKLPSITQAEMADKTGDSLVKIVAVGQVLGFFIQIGSRLTYRIPTSQLEIVVCSFAVCTALTYCLLLDKPKNTTITLELEAMRYPTPREAIRIAAVGPWPIMLARRDIWIPNYALHRDSTKNAPIDTWRMGAMASLVIFGALHCLAWDFEFPTPIEGILWRVSSIVTMAMLPLATLSSLAGHIVWKCISRQSGLPPTALRIGGSINMACSVVFVACRVFIIVEMLRSLAFLPPGAFRANWSANLPHVG